MIMRKYLLGFKVAVNNEIRIRIFNTLILQMSLFLLF